ncbi:ProQ/FINO family protein [Azospirillum thiophilum]|uniref:ProQ/FINO family protein n=1 Tax=Azospirillum thiophilum TaxID=528244 RepID=UPI000696F073|nr:ProQ/FinO family protein [Azospirillum thiophilum]
MKMLTTPPLADDTPGTPVADDADKRLAVAARMSYLLNRMTPDRLRLVLTEAERIVAEDDAAAGTKRRTGLRADRRALAVAFPACFNPPKSKAPKRPLKIGITADIVARGVTGEDGQPLSRKRIERAVRDYCLGTKYDAALIPGAIRIDLDGNPAGSVSASHAASRRREEG